MFTDVKLPDNCDFFSSLKDGCVSKKDHFHATEVWIMFKMNKIGNSYDLYLRKTFYY